MLSADFSSATAFTWGEKREGRSRVRRIDPAVFESAEVYDGTPDVVCLCRFKMRKAIIHIASGVA